MVSRASSWLLFASCRKGNNEGWLDDRSALTNVCSSTLLRFRTAEEDLATNTPDHKFSLQEHYIFRFLLACLEDTLWHFFSLTLITKPETLSSVVSNAIKWWCWWCQDFAISRFEIISPCSTTSSKCRDYKPEQCKSILVFKLGSDAASDCLFLPL